MEEERVRVENTRSLSLYTRRNASLLTIPRHDVPRRRVECNRCQSQRERGLRGVENAGEAFLLEHLDESGHDRGGGCACKTVGNLWVVGDSRNTPQMVREVGVARGTVKRTVKRRREEEENARQERGKCARTCFL